MKLGEYLKQKREENTWTQPEAAKKAQIEQSYLSKLETGKSYPSEHIFNRLVRLYKININDLNKVIDMQEYEKLSEIKQMRQLIIEQKKSELTIVRGWLISGLVFLMISGACFAITHLYGGAQAQYYYRSNGVLQEGEPLLAFDIINQDIPENDTQRIAKQQQMMLRMKQDDKITSAYKGKSYVEDMPDGKRFYELYSQGEVAKDSGMNWFLLPALMFFLGSFGCFFISYRWKK